MERIMDVLVGKAEELGEDVRKSISRVLIKTAAPGLFRGTLYGLAGKALMQYLQNRVAVAEGNGSNVSPEMDWKRPTSTPSNYS